MKIGQGTANILDYVVIGICGVVFLVSLCGAVAVVLLSRAPSCADSSDFNKLWRARVFMQLFGALYALSQLLRLQVLWGPASVLVDGGFYSADLCRAFTAFAWGLFEPVFLLLALFSCVFSLQGPRSFTEHLNTSIVLFATVLSMPVCGGQIVCALFTEIFDMDFMGNWLLRTLFTTYDSRLQDNCNQRLARLPEEPSSSPPASMPPPADSSGNHPVVYDDNCAFCTFALFSTLISASFGVCMLLALLFVTQKVVTATINKILVRRIRILQLLTTLFIITSLVCRGVTTLYEPFLLDFEILRLVSVVCIAGTILTLSSILVFYPLWDSYSANKQMYKLLHQEDQNFTTNPLRLRLRGPSCLTGGQANSGSRSPLVKNASQV